MELPDEISSSTGLATVVASLEEALPRQSGPLSASAVDSEISQIQSSSDSSAVYLQDQDDDDEYSDEEYSDSDDSYDDSDNDNDTVDRLENLRGQRHSPAYEYHPLILSNDSDSLPVSTNGPDGIDLSHVPLFLDVQPVGCQRISFNRAETWRNNLVQISLYGFMFVADGEVCFCLSTLYKCLLIILLFFRKSKSSEFFLQLVQNFLYLPRFRHP